MVSAIEEEKLSTNGSSGNYTKKPYLASEIVYPILRQGSPNPSSPGCCYPQNHDVLLPNEIYGERQNIIVVQKILKTPFRWDVLFERIDNPVQEPVNFDQVYSKYNLEFEKKFDQSFAVTNFIKGGDLDIDEYKEFARQVLSSLLYGLSYFEGNAFAQDPNTGRVWELKDRKLLTFIPSKSGFPRGFYWDEAFHQMVNLYWNKELFESITRYWYNLQNETTGWIAREQLIGDECRSRAPEWAWPGIITHMNPPVYFITTMFYWKKYKEQAIPFLKEMFPKFQKTYNW